MLAAVAGRVGPLTDGGGGGCFDDCSDGSTSSTVLITRLIFQIVSTIDLIKSNHTRRIKLILFCYKIMISEYIYDKSSASKFSVDRTIAFERTLNSYSGLVYHIRTNGLIQTKFLAKKV